MDIFYNPITLTQVGGTILDYRFNGTCQKYFNKYLFCVGLLQMFKRNGSRLAIITVR